MTYTWTNDDTSIGLAASGTGDIASFTATNTGTAPVIATIVVTPHFENGSVTCDGPSKTFTITVNPTAEVNQPAKRGSLQWCINNCSNLWYNKYRRYSNLYLDK